MSLSIVLKFFLLNRFSDSSLAREHYFFPKDLSVTELFGVYVFHCSALGFLCWSIVPERGCPPFMGACIHVFFQIGICFPLEKSDAGVGTNVGGWGDWWGYTPLPNKTPAQVPPVPKQVGGNRDKTLR